MQLLNVGYSPIEKDLRRLRKRFKSLEDDLGNYFVIHKNSMLEFGVLSCTVHIDENYIICKDRIAIKNPKTPPSSGCRLWFIIEKRSGRYIPCLLYAANEESDFKKSVCFKIVSEVISSLIK